MAEPQKLIAMYQEAIRQIKVNLEFELNQIEGHKKAVEAMKKAIKKYEDKIEEAKWENMTVELF